METDWSIEAQEKLQMQMKQALAVPIEFRVFRLEQDNQLLRSQLVELQTTIARMRSVLNKE